MKTTFSFLKKLKAYNNRDWFGAHKDQYEAARQEFLALTEKVLAGIKKFDRKIDPDMQAAQCLFRIYRDVRFSKDKTPYKQHFSASINPGGRKSITAGYYLHIEPGNSFVAGGVWMPPSPMLQAIRQEIDYEPEPLLKIMKSAGFKKYFSDFDDEGRMQTAPKGYAKDHPQIGMLRNRNFIVSHNFSDKQILSGNVTKELIAAFKAMHPLMDYLRKGQEVSE